LTGELELGLVQEINRLLAPHEWPLKEVCLEIERDKARNAFGSSIRQALAAKGGVGATDLELLLTPDRAEEPLKPGKKVEPVALAKLEELFEPEGLLASNLSSYERREPQ